MTDTPRFRPNKDQNNDADKHRREGTFGFFILKLLVAVFAGEPIEVPVDGLAPSLDFRQFWRRLAFVPLRRRRFRRHFKGRLGGLFGLFAPRRRYRTEVLFLGLKLLAGWRGGGAKDSS